MNPLLIAVALGALPCGVTDEDQPCEAGGAPRGLACWSSSGGGSLISYQETKWIDLRTCTAGSLLLTTAKGSSKASFSIPELPAGVKRDAKLQAALTAALVPPPADPKDPRHALAVMKKQKLSESVTVLPPEPWWPGPVAKQANSAGPLDTPGSDDLGECPCSLRFDGEQYRRVREWKVGTQTISMWASLHVERGNLAFAVTDEGNKRHRWLFSTTNWGKEPEPHLEGTRWYLPVGHAMGEAFTLLGYDASTGEAWGVELTEVHSLRVTEGGVTLQRGKKPITRTWSSLGPGGK